MPADVDQRALAGLKFHEALPERLATATLAARLADLDSAARVLAEPASFTVVDHRCLRSLLRSYVLLTTAAARTISALMVLCL